MRKPRDFDAELEALDQKSRALRQRKVMQLGTLVGACGADTLPIEMLAGALLAAATSTDDAQRTAWTRAGEAMFRAQVSGGAARGKQKAGGRTATGHDAASSPDGGAGQD